MFRLRVALCSVILYLGLANLHVECSEVESYLELETLYINQLEKYLEKEQEKNEKISRYLDYVDLVHKLIEDPEDYFGNPLNAFVTISRLVNNWQHEIISEVTSNKDFENLNQTLHNELSFAEVDEPTEDNLLEATSEVLAFQGSHALTTSKLASGDIEDEKDEHAEPSDDDSKQAARLSASECYTMGRNLHKLQLYDVATEWLLQARSHLFRDANTFPVITDVHILDSLSSTYEELGHLKLANKFNNDILRADKLNEAALKHKIELERKLVLERSEIQINM